MDYQTFKTKDEASKYAGTMRGWYTKPVKMTVASEDGKSKVSRWVIECRTSKHGMRFYLRNDGYVR